MCPADLSAHRPHRRWKSTILLHLRSIDSYAHTAALKSEGYTIAVLGCGADICYPAEHQELYEKISKSGCIISQYPPGTKPRQYMFPQRNRLVAALSDDLYVVDTGEKSGTETTIAACIAYGGGRKVHQEFLSPIY